MGDLICVGRLAGAFGVRGEVRLKALCADPEAIAGLQSLANAVIATQRAAARDDGMMGPPPIAAR